MNDITPILVTVTNTRLQWLAESVEIIEKHMDGDSYGEYVDMAELKDLLRVGVATYREALKAFSEAAVIIYANKDTFNVSKGNTKQEVH